MQSRQEVRYGRHQICQHILQERERLHRQREEIFNQQQELENRLAAVTGEFEAINAYEAAKTGKAISAPPVRARSVPVPYSL